MNDEIEIDGVKYKKVIKNKFDDKNIIVPECIKIVCGFSDKGNKLGLLSKDEKRVIYYDEDVSTWQATTEFIKDFVECKLIKCDKEDLQVGDLAFCIDDIEEDELEELGNYCVIINNEEQVYFQSNSIMETDLEFEHWYKVVECDK